MERTRYSTFVSDNARWDAFVPRDGDVVISTPPKCGTTWMQMCSALLILDSADLPAPLATLSPWLDMLTRPLDDVIADLEVQAHRRFIKSHTPLDGLPWDPRITYVAVGRDPRDVALSWDNHLANMDFQAFFEARSHAIGTDDLDAVLADMTPPPADPIERFWFWMEDDELPGANLLSTMRHLETFWVRRDEPNVALFHYRDLETDLVGELRRLADALAIDVSDERLAELAVAASFGEMKARAETLAPSTDVSLWQDASNFFHRGSSGRWREVMGESDLPRYEARIASVVPDPELREWVHGGWRKA